MQRALISRAGVKREEEVKRRRKRKRRRGLAAASLLLLQFFYLFQECLTCFFKSLKIPFEEKLLEVSPENQLFQQASCFKHYIFNV